MSALKHASESLFPQTLTVAGRFRPNSTSAPIVSDTGKNRGWSVEYVSAGRYRLTFAGFKWMALQSFICGVRRDDVNEGSILHWTDFDNSAGTLDILTLTESVDPSGTTNTRFGVVNLAVDTDNEIHFNAVFRTSTV